MDSSQDAIDPDGVVRWVASQSPVPALQALIREAEHDRKARRSRPPHEPASWTYPHDLQRKCSVSSAVCCSARPRSSSHSLEPSPSMGKYGPREDGPEATAFVELLRDVSRQLDENSRKKQRLVVRTKEKDRDLSLGRASIDNRMSVDSRPRPLAKTSSTSAICSVASTTRANPSDPKPKPRGRAMGKTASLGAPGVDLVSGKSAPHSLPSSNLNCDLKLAPAPRPPFSFSNTTQLNSPSDGDSPMQDVIDITDTDTEWERPMSGSAACPDTSYMQVDDDDSDAQMDLSFFRTEPPPQPRTTVAPKPKAQPPQPRPSAPTQRSRTGPPPLGMRRTPHIQASQYSASQASKSLTVPRFKPPLLANANTGATNKVGGGGSKPTSRGKATKVYVAEPVVQKDRDADSSFDVSFGMDADELEEAMKAYD